MWAERGNQAALCSVCPPLCIPPRASILLSLHPCILPSIPASFPPSLHPAVRGSSARLREGWMHPRPFLPSACGVGDPAGAAGGAGGGGCPLARALPRRPVPRQPGGAGDAAGLGRAAGAAAGDPGPRAAGRPAAALLQGLLSHDVSGDELSGLRLRRPGGSCREHGIAGAWAAGECVGSARAAAGQDHGEPGTMGCAGAHPLWGSPTASCPARPFVATPASCFQPCPRVGMASPWSAGLRRGRVISQPVLHMPTAPGRRTHGLRSSPKARVATASQRLRVRSWRGG